MDDKSFREEMERLKHLDEIPEIDAEVAEINCNKSLKNIPNVADQSNVADEWNTELPEGYDTVPELDTPFDESLEEIPKLKQEIIEACEKNGGETTLANIMENNTSSGSANNFLAALILAAEGKLNFILMRNEKEANKLEELGVQLYSQS